MISGWDFLRPAEQSPGFPNPKQTTDPNDKELIKKLSQIAQTEICSIFSLPSEIEAGISINYQTEKGLKESLADLRSLDLRLNDDMSEGEISEIAENSSLIEIVN